MYKNGELDEVENTLKTAPIYLGGTIDRADKKEVALEGGRTSMRYLNNNYYNNGNVNQLFILYLHGYGYGKHIGLSQSA